MKVRHTYKNDIDRPTTLLLHQDGPALLVEHRDGLQLRPDVILNRVEVEDYVGYLQRWLETGRLCDV